MGVILLNLDSVLNLIGMNEYQRRRIVDRTVDLALYREVDRSDGYRLDQMATTRELFENQFLPRGYIIKNTAITGDGIHTDFPLYEVGYTFGNVLGVALLGFFAAGILRTVRIVPFRYPPGHTDLAIAGYALVMLYFLVATGTFLYFPTETPLTGLILGRLMRRPRVYVYPEAGRPLC
jgi:hypothetical protein